MLGEWRSLDDIRIDDGATIAIGGIASIRKPMGLLRAIVDAGVRDLVVISFLGGLDVELLLAAGAVRELHTAGVSLDAAGLAPRYRAARQSGSVRVMEWSEGSLHAALEATARGLPSLPCGTAPGSDVVAANPHLTVAPDPFTGAPVVVARALPVDVGLLHVPGASAAGDLFIDGDAGVDGTIARAAATVVASASRRRDDPPARAAISRVWVDAVVALPDGAWPTWCHPTEVADLDVVRRWARDPDAPLALLTREAS